MSDTFKIYIPLSTWEKSGEENPLRIGGIVSTDGLDRQGERVVQDGLDFAPFLRHGWYNDNHGQKTTDVLGYPTSVERVKKGQKLPDGSKSQHNGWWAEGYLLDTDEGRKVYSLAQSLGKSGGDRRLGFSIEGKVLARDRREHSKIVRAEVRNVAVTHCPVNTDTHLNALAKALMAGHAIEAPTGSESGDGFALRTESMDKRKKKDEDDVEKVELVDISADNLDDDDSDGGLAKATAATAPTIDSLQYLSRWADSVADYCESKRKSNVSLTKAEASIIVSYRYPNLSTKEVDDIVAEATGGIQ